MPDTQEPVIVVAEGEQYALLSSGNGATYILRSKEDRASTYIEGDDVAAFLTEFDTVKAQYPNYDTDRLLAQLWDQGGYSWMATPDEE
ncbi:MULTISPECIES: hypothetical protein [Methylocaldum]|jgi:hypothetical protein|uniref:hypothetical protein n=1 Tax=unclassified Methylocaldum TaxID=2622260 RepID=UPI00098B5456|nr:MULTISPECIES: hypothetical protein [unclassified Methylocaldum]MBP1148647.1 hypothetical protein [Methylocaldum sp. RMAD-M]MDV3242014.1 hypothetical protein [Methylocaldum sp.]